MNYYIEKTKLAGEEIIERFNINNFICLNDYLIMFFGVFLFVIGFLFPFEDKSFIILFLTVGLLSLFTGLYMYLSLSSINMGIGIITNKRVVVKETNLSLGTQEIRLQEIRLEEIETIDVNQSIIGKMLGYGTVKVTGVDYSVVLFKDVDEPLKIKQTIESVLSKYGEGKISE